MSRYLDLVSDRRPIDLQALLQTGFFSPGVQQPQGQAGPQEFGLDDFSRETGISQADLTPFFKDMEQALQSDPQLLQQLNEIRERMGLPAIKDAGQAGLEDPNSLLGEDLMALLIMWALQQQEQRKGQTLGNLQGSNYSNVRPVDSGNWRGMNSVGGGGSGKPTGEHPDLSNMPTGSGSVGDFLKAALAQDGDKYVFGHEVDLKDANPDTFDCSELVQWACAQAGINIPDGTMNQEPYLQQHGTQMSVEEAIRTPGALLYKDGHVAISLGDGRTIEAKGSAYGVKIDSAEGRFTRAYKIPGMNYG